MSRVPDRPLPGDLVIRPRMDRVGPLERVVEVWVVTRWPDEEMIVAGPYQSYNYALEQARRLVRDEWDYVWRDHARFGEAERLEVVVGGS